VTELKQAERELNAVQLELAHAARLALVGELTTSIMHEIRQPLAAIVTDADAGMRYAARDPELHEIFREIHNVGLNAAAIIERLQALARKRPLELRPLDLNHVVHDVLHLVAADAHNRGVTMHAELSPALPTVYADRVCLQQVILNLIVNAMDAVGETAERVITVRTWSGKDAIEIGISDTGNGIPADRLPKLFEAFFTTKADGVGLGLAVSRSIVEAHAGRIWAENGTGRGATFRLTLPIQAATS